MLDRVGRMLRGFFAGLRRCLKPKAKPTVSSFELRDLLPADFEARLKAETDAQFLVLSSPEEYTREILYIYHAHASSFRLDRNHTDGHFRV